MIYRLKRFSAVRKSAGNKILNTGGSKLLGFDRSRKYDMDMNRLGRMGSAQRELSKPNELNREIRKLSKELHNIKN